MPPKKQSPVAHPASLIREDERKSDPLFQSIRRLALSEQKDTPQLFLSLRRAAARYEVPVSTMAGVYRRLAQEGLLSTVRSSRTILRGRHSIRKLKVRGVVAMPVLGPQVHTLQHYRQAFLCLRNELHRAGFSIVPIYSGQRTADADQIVERCKEERADIVVWLSPEGLAREITGRIRDLGLDLVGVNLSGISDGLCRYEVRRVAAIRAILDRWKIDGVAPSVVIVVAGLETDSELARINRLRSLLEGENNPCRVTSVPEGRISRFLKSLCASRSYILLPGSAAAMLGSRAPDRVANVFEHCHIALIDGPLEAPFSDLPAGIRAHFVNVDWPDVSKQIVHDIVSGEAFAQFETTVFEAQAHFGPINGDGQGAEKNC
jgi:hypothetical protein